MRVVIYESSSQGGCFEYAKEIFKAYSIHREVTICEILIPVHSSLNEKNTYKILCDDLKKSRISFIRRAYFIIRTALNPFILFFFLLKRKASLVIFNDFEQLSAFLWVPFFKWFLNKHSFAVVLHDPDRDQYPPSKAFSESSMEKLMSLMNFGLYHESLPNKKYYRTSNTKYLDVPHGIYNAFSQDLNFAEDIKKEIGDGYQSMAILGNIRKEKNYHLAIESLLKFPFLKLIIAGKLANQEVELTSYKILAEKLEVANRIIWIEKYLSDGELSSLINIADVILLNYARSFKSQSGILNLIAPFRKNMVVSSGESGLHQLVKKFKNGVLVEPDNLDALNKGISIALQSDFSSNWTKYLEFASWKHHTDMVIEAHKSTKKY